MVGVVLVAVPSRGTFTLRPVILVRYVLIDRREAISRPVPSDPCSTRIHRDTRNRIGVLREPEVSVVIGVPAP